MFPQISVHGVLQGLAGLELHLLRGGDGDLLARPRIPALRCRARRDIIGAEANQTNLIPASQSAGDGVKQGINRLGCICLGERRGFSDARNKFILVQWNPRPEILDPDYLRTLTPELSRGAGFRQRENPTERSEPGAPARRPGCSVSG